VAIGDGVGEIAAAYTEGLINRAELFDRESNRLSPPSGLKSKVTSLFHEGCDRILVIGSEAACDRVRRQLAPELSSKLAIGLVQPGAQRKPSLARSLAELHVCGVPLDWKVICGSGRLILGLPGHSWQRRRHWTAHAVPARDERPRLSSPANPPLEPGEPQAVTADTCTYRLSWHPRSIAVHPGAATGELAAGREASEKTASVTLRIYAEIEPKLDELCANYLTQALLKLGCLSDVAPLGCESRTRRIADRYQPFVRRWLARLEQLHLLRRDASGALIATPAAAYDAERVIQSLKTEFPACAPELDLLARSGRQSAEILSGETDPLQVLFCDEAISTVEDVYHGSPFSLAFHPLICDTVRDHVRRVGSRPITILEVGAGTGATTRALLASLAEETGDYLFTDVSGFFINRAKKSFARYPQVRFARYDISQPPEPQGLAGAPFD